MREEASKKLWEAGEAAEAGGAWRDPKSGDAEVARRAGELDEKFRWGIYPNTPPKVLELITRYQSADENGRLAIVREMFDAGGTGCATLLKIARAEKDANFRRRLFGADRRGIVPCHPRPARRRQLRQPGNSPGAERRRRRRGRHAQLRRLLPAARPAR